MCVNFMNLSKVCPKDHYLFPSIDRLADSTSRHVVVSFFDAISWYHQILKEPEDVRKKAFIMDEPSLRTRGGFLL